ncbi:serine/threonine-protein kinase SIK2-like isoform X2 [Clytia hemisphaerica]|eukprot:TCONS_00051720-protein
MDRTNEDFKTQPVRVGFYDMEETIGKGNFAVVKLARHKITKSRVAIKIIDKSRLDEANLKKIYREVQIMKLLRHPNVLKLYQVMETKNMLYIVMEYATKGEMFAHIDKYGQLSEDEARNFFWQIISAVEYCHNRKVVHRDLKTENLLLDENLNVKIADFGFSNYTSENELLSTWCGSPPYAAPEIFEGKEYDGPAIDIWSLGVVLYVLVCAALPFDGESVHEVRDRVLEGRFRVPYFMSSELEDLIKKILVKNPSQRYTLNQIKGHPWMLKAPLEKRSFNPNIQNLECNGFNGELNSQVLQLMQTLNIDITKTKKSVEQNAYDHHSAIYHLLSERLKQHRTSYPEKSNVGTRIRRASCMADQAIVRNNRVQALVNHQQYRLPSSQSRNPHAQLQYALNELHLGDVKIPPEICSSNVPGCVTEFIPPITTQASYTSRLSHVTTHVSSAQSNIETVTEEGCVGEQPVSNPPPTNKRRGRRSAVDAMVHMNNSRRHTVQGPPNPDTLYVPANHPLLRQENSEKPPESGNEFANRVKIQIIEPTVPVTEQTSMSMTLQPNAQPKIVPISPLAHKDIGFKEGRRASDGVNAPFRHLLHKAENQYLKEYQELQKLLQRSLTPNEIGEQQFNHNQFIESGGCATQNGQTPDWKSSPLSSQNELMMTLQSMHLVNQDKEGQNEQESWNNGLGPCRRQAPYRKMSGGYSPLPAHIRKRRTPVLGESPFSSFDSGMDD